MTKRIKMATAVALTLAGAAGALPAQARMAMRTPLVPAGEIADAPTGFVEMCARDQSLCLAGHEATPPSLAAAPSLSFAMAPAVFDGAPSFAAPALEASALEAPAWPAIPLPGYVPQAAPWGPSVMAVSLMLAIADPVSPFPASFGLPRPVPAMAIATGAVDTMRARKAAPDDAPSVAAPALVPGDVRADLALLRKVNAVVNTYVRQVADIDTAGVAERWDRPGIGRNAAGDCEDLAIEKRMELIEAGFDPSRMAFAVVYKRNYGMHIVLIVRTEKGDMVLDSLSPRVLRWDKTKYSWLRIQSMDDPNRWYRVGAPPLPAPPLPVPPTQIVTAGPVQALS